MDTAWPLLLVDRSTAGEMVRLFLNGIHNAPNTFLYCIRCVHTCRCSLVQWCIYVRMYMQMHMSCSNYCLLLGNYGKLGHGDTTTQKIPKLISFFEGKVLSLFLFNIHT